MLGDCGNAVSTSPEALTRCRERKTEFEKILDDVVPRKSQPGLSGCFVAQNSRVTRSSGSDLVRWGIHLWFG